MRSRWIVGSLAAPLLLALAARTSVERRFLFRTDRAAQAAIPADAALVTTTARDGVVVHALDLGRSAGAPVVVHFHNNSESAAGPVAMGRALRARGLGVVLVEYRGYGVSRGVAPDEAGLYLDAEAALDWLAARGVGRERVVLSGTSLGTGVAAEMARRGRGAALVLISPYTSIPDLVGAWAPFGARWLVTDRFETLAKAGEIRVPTLVVHGDADDVVPVRMGERLASAIHGARFVLVPGGRHGDGDLFARDGDLVGDVVRLARGAEGG